MKIKVFYPQKVGQVDASELNQLIEKGKIMAFEREHKLVVVGIHRTRLSSSKVHANGRRAEDAKERSERSGHAKTHNNGGDNTRRGDPGVRRA